MMKLPPYSMLSRANLEMLNRPRVVASRANMDDIPCGQIPAFFRRDSSSASTLLPSPFLRLHPNSIQFNSISKLSSFIHWQVTNNSKLSFFWKLFSNFFSNFHLIWYHLIRSYLIRSYIIIILIKLNVCLCFHYYLLYV